METVDERPPGIADTIFVLAFRVIGGLLLLVAALAGLDGVLSASRTPLGIAVVAALVGGALLVLASRLGRSKPR